MSALPSHDPACEVLLAVARDDSRASERKCQTLFGLMDACQTLGQWLRRELARSDLTENGFRLLAQVIKHEAEGITPTDVSTGLGLPRQVISTILGRLEVSGLITRQRNTQDRRTFTLKATPEGHRVFSSALHHCLQSINRLMSTLEPQDADRLDQACARLRDLFSENTPSRV